MILNTAPQNEAILSNVGEIGEFRIRNSAKAFNILSSGLYANKIRAIIRELSCNATDSHVAAGNGDKPFDLHLPTVMEPWFAVRDYGTGLNHDQVTNIYTTYFESTKTNSNDFIGALGLGSKSPFSYTDNFTVTAIKDGVKRIYSAFINDAGVPSIAKMGEEDTTETNGVEIKFAVNERYDYTKFKQEAEDVFTFFKVKPNVIGGGSDFKIKEIKYETMDIAPGVHSRVLEYRMKSIAVMGNIAYPIDIPEADKSLGDLRRLLNCGLVMHFDIGELDFQASREGLSYIPQTIASIKAKLEQVVAKLQVRLAEEADAITNEWNRSIFLYSKKRVDLWSAAVTEYVNKTKFDLVEIGGYASQHSFDVTEEKLANDFNITMRGFSTSRGSSVCPTIKPSSRNKGRKTADGNVIYEQEWDLSVSNQTKFVVNDTKVGASERAKHHWRTLAKESKDYYRNEVYVLEPTDKTKPMKTEEFYKFLRNPPVDQRFMASNLDKKERNSTGGGIVRNAKILELKQQNRGYNKQMVWSHVGELKDFDKTKTYYYIPLSGFNVVSITNLSIDAKELYSTLNTYVFDGIPNNFYGVRKSDIEAVKQSPNWINVEEKIKEVLNNITEKDLLPFVLDGLANAAVLRYDTADLCSKLPDSSPFKKAVSNFVGVERRRYNEYAIASLYRRYGSDQQMEFRNVMNKYHEQFKELVERYPLLKDYVGASVDAVVEYVSLIDMKKGV